MVAITPKALFIANNPISNHSLTSLILRVVYCQFYKAMLAHMYTKCIGIGSNFILGGPNLGGMPPSPFPGKFGSLDTLRLFHRAILQVLQQSPAHCCSWGTKVAAQLGLEGSPVLDMTDVAYSPPK